MHRLLRFSFRFPASFVADSVVLLFRLGATPPPRSLRASSMRIPLACCLLSCCVPDVDLFYLSFSSFPLSISIRTSHVSSCLFLAGTSYAVASVSVSVATRSAYMILRSIYQVCILIRTVRPLISPFIFV